MLTKANLSRLLANMPFHPIGGTKMARKRHWKKIKQCQEKTKYVLSGNFESDNCGLFDMSGKVWEWC